MKFSSSQILHALTVLSWILFIGISIEAGGFILNTLFGLFSEGGTQRFWEEADLSPLRAHDRTHYAGMSIYICIVAVLRAILFYQIVRFLSSKRLDPDQPFHPDVLRFVLNTAEWALVIGASSWIGGKYAQWLAKTGITMPALSELRLSGADAWVFMGVVLLVIGHIFKKGIEIQSENELTV